MGPISEPISFPPFPTQDSQPLVGLISECKSSFRLPLLLFQLIIENCAVVWYAWIRPEAIEKPSTGKRESVSRRSLQTNPCWCDNFFPFTRTLTLTLSSTRPLGDVFFLYARPASLQTYLTRELSSSECSEIKTAISHQSSTNGLFFLKLTRSVRLRASQDSRMRASRYWKCESFVPRP